MKPEAQLCKDFMKLANTIPNMQYHERIENAVNTATPDWTYTCNGLNGWVEFKVAQAPALEKTCLTLTHWSKLQREWMQKRLTCPTVFLLLRVGEWDYLFDTHSMFTLESLAYCRLKLHPWRFKSGDPNFWDFKKLHLLSYKLQGIDNLKTQEEFYEEY